MPYNVVNFADWAVAQMYYSANGIVAENQQKKLKAYKLKFKGHEDGGIKLFKK